MTCTDITMREYTLMFDPEKYDPKKREDHVYFKNAQWAVTGYGMEAWPKERLGFFIEAGDLAKRWPGDEKMYDWPVHALADPWVDVEMFLEAFQWALYVHAGRYGEPPSLHLFSRSALAARRRAFSARQKKMNRIHDGH